MLVSEGFHLRGFGRSVDPMQHHGSGIRHDSLFVVLALEPMAMGIVVLLHLRTRDNLLSIGGGTVFYMILVQFVFV